MPIQNNRANTQFLRKLEQQVNQTIGLLRRISNRRRGIREEERIRLIQAFIISKITYSLPYLNPSAAELDKINRLIRRAYKSALHLPLNTPTARFEGLGVHNTAEELIEAHLSNQVFRLSKTPTGNHILRRLGIGNIDCPEAKIPLPSETHAKLTIKPIPRNMHPTYHACRREQRARALQKRLSARSGVVYVDAAEYRHRAAFAIAVINDPDNPPLDSLTLNTPYPSTAEEAAIALALSQKPTPSIVISDFKAAIQNFANGHVSPQASIILRRHPPDSPVEIVWSPAHAGLAGNEAAHNTARGLTIRAGASLVPYHGARSARDRLLTYREITVHYRLDRRRYPPAHITLTNSEEHTGRLLQTNTFPNPAILHRILPSLYPSPEYIACGSLANLPHIFWGCPKDPFPLISCDEQWEEALGSSDLGVQTFMVTRAADVATRHKPAATTAP